MQYREDRYMRDLPNAELFTRAGDLIIVSVHHSKFGKLSPCPSKIEQFTHVLEELAIRGIHHRLAFPVARIAAAIASRFVLLVPQQKGIAEAMRLPKPNSPKVRRSLKILERRTWPRPRLVKFGSRHQMPSLFLEGKGRISLAATYDDASLGYDKESEMTVYVHPKVRIV